MFGIPGQTLEMWERTLNEALALQSEHLACYELIYEEDTPSTSNSPPARSARMKTWGLRCTTCCSTAPTPTA
jgi:coproporphyrinogen III oxidase-like Fe-S oxidoreductase